MPTAQQKRSTLYFVWKICAVYACAVCSLFAQSPIHHSVAAGIFFPGTRDSLLQAVQECSREAKQPPPLHAVPIGIMAPHAGYDYSGPVEASAYRAAEQGMYSTVVIMGPSHFIPFMGVAIAPSGSWETPIGRIDIDEASARQIMHRCSFVRDSAALFAREHSIETQVPFIQRMWPKCRIVPLELGTMTGEQYSGLADALAAIVNESPGRTLIVASSDLSHYHTDSQARHMDNVTLTDILSTDAGRLVTDLNSRAAEMCGYAPVITMMLMADRLGAHPTMLAYANTSSATGDTTRVVGYSALVYTVGTATAQLSSEDKHALLDIARGALVAAAKHIAAPVIDNANAVLDENAGLFVTLTKHGNLRGCIGTLRATEPLWKAASDMADNAALRDPRFTPVTPAEVSDIRIEISVLSPLVPVHVTDSIHIGTDGLYLIDGTASGVLLPQVATDNHWDRAEFLRQVCLKAGLSENAWKDNHATLYSFTATVFAEQDK